MKTKNRPRDNHPATRPPVGAVVRCIVAVLYLLTLASSVGAATIAEVAAKIKSLKSQEKLNYLLKGAQAEGELACYGRDRTERERCNDWNG